MFVDLTTAYDTVWQRGLTCKLLRLLPDRHMVHMIMEMVGNRSFTLTTGNCKRSRSRRLKNGVPQGCPGAPSLQHQSDLPTTISRKYAYADDSGIARPKFGGAKKILRAKMIDFTRITLFFLENRLSKHKMTIFFKIFLGEWPLSPPHWLRLWLTTEQSCMLMETGSQ